MYFCLAAASLNNGSLSALRTRVIRASGQKILSLEKIQRAKALLAAADVIITQLRDITLAPSERARRQLFGPEDRGSRTVQAVHAHDAHPG